MNNESSTSRESWDISGLTRCAYPSYSLAQRQRPYCAATTSSGSWFSLLTGC
ncbi:hypothetical protein DPMN_122517 [Dreissena polymorpha]|uniref:Uncharacterized protein n=1 Tax=Dreissena polymorpha TaxID=45954 RepID=A0A9D4GS20_DREPO|nr:hypothetical protein DPMN_122517 [Dreissena polymorpha]